MVGLKCISTRYSSLTKNHNYKKHYPSPNSRNHINSNNSIPYNKKKIQIPSTKQIKIAFPYLNINKQKDLKNLL